MPTWFESLTGISEQSAEHVRSQLALFGTEVMSPENGRKIECGTLLTPSLAELREETPQAPPLAGFSSRSPLPLREVVADVQDLHVDPDNQGAMFQVASQFNLLEMAAPSVTPEEGVGIYERDNTQGPACAIAAGAGTIYRNYFAMVGKNRGSSSEMMGRERGQSAGRQINCLKEVGEALGNEDRKLWTMRNGYALATRSGLETIAERLGSVSETEREELRGRLRIGLQLDTEVTLENASHLVSQALCSALPVSYSSHPAALWEPFARFVLKGAYEATLRAAHLNGERTGNNTAFLTLLGGGAFGNEPGWILDGLERGLRVCAPLDIDAAVVSYGRPNPELKPLLSPAT
jgi:hypothetical protein